MTRTSIFPERFAEPSFGATHSETVPIDENVRKRLRNGADEVTLYSIDDRYDHLKQTDVVPVYFEKQGEGEELYLKVTHLRTLQGEEVLNVANGNSSMRFNIEPQIERVLEPTDKLRVVEVMAIYGWQLRANRPVL